MTRTGGCLCGAVRYEVEWPPQATVVCHCHDCQKQSGSAFSLITVIKREHLRLSGDCATFSHPGSSGGQVDRHFCPGCGSGIFSETEAGKCRNVVFLKAGTLDLPEDLTPSIHYWTDSAQNWFSIPATATCLARQ